MSSIILLVIVVAWLVVLIPVLLRRHDAGSERRSTDRFASAMRVLSRRTPDSARSRELLRPAGRSTSAAPSVTVNGTTRVDPETLRARLGRTRPVPTQALERPLAEVRAADARSRVDSRPGRCAARRRGLAVLVTLAAVTAAAAVVLSPMLWVVQVGVDLLVVAFIAQSRRQSRVAAQQRVRSVARRGHHGVDGREQIVREARASRAAAAAAAARREVTIEKAEDGSWHPVPVPVPTYVTAPVHRPEQPQHEEEFVAGGTRDADQAIEELVAAEMADGRSAAERHEAAWGPYQDNNDFVDDRRAVNE